MLKGYSACKITMSKLKDKNDKRKTSEQKCDIVIFEYYLVLMHTFHFLILPAVHLLDLAVPLQMLSSIKELGIAPAQVQCIGPHSSVKTLQCLGLTEIHSLPPRMCKQDTVVVVGGKMQDTSVPSRSWTDAVNWLSDLTPALMERDVTLAAVGTGAFLLGEAGLLDGRMCTTHHQFLSQLRRRYRKATVMENQTFVGDGNIWTSAGLGSGINLALRLVVRDFGDDAAIRVARENEVPFRRFDDDPPPATHSSLRSHSNNLVHSVQDAISKNLGAQLSVGALAQKFAIGERQLSRLFALETGTTLKWYQLSLRMARARKLLISTNMSIKEVAANSGFASVQAFRVHWNKLENATPLEVRRERELRHGEGGTGQ